MNRSPRRWTGGLTNKVAAGGGEEGFLPSCTRGPQEIDANKKIGSRYQVSTTTSGLEFCVVQICVVETQINENLDHTCGWKSQDFNNDLTIEPAKLWDPAFHQVLVDVFTLSFLVDNLQQSCPGVFDNHLEDLEFQPRKHQFMSECCVKVMRGATFLKFLDTLQADNFRFHVPPAGWRCCILCCATARQTAASHNTYPGKEDRPLARTNGGAPTLQTRVSNLRFSHVSTDRKQV